MRCVPVLAPCRRHVSSKPVDYHGFGTRVASVVHTVCRRVRTAVLFTHLGRAHSADDAVTLTHRLNVERWRHYAVPENIVKFVGVDCTVHAS
jgi:hypothetical protein